jgi:hypothetical protein
MQPPPRAEGLHISDFHFQHEARYEATLDMRLFQAMLKLMQPFALNVLQISEWQIIEQIRIAKLRVSWSCSCSNPRWPVRESHMPKVHINLYAGFKKTLRVREG